MLHRIHHFPYLFISSFEIFLLCLRVTNSRSLIRVEFQLVTRTNEVLESHIEQLRFLKIAQFRRRGVQSVLHLINRNGVGQFGFYARHVSVAANHGKSRKTDV